MRAIFALLFLLSFQVQTLFGQAERSVIQAFNATGVEQVILDLPGELIFLTAPGDLIQIESAIRLENAGAPILKALIHAMRYSLTSEKVGSDLFIQPGNRKAPVTVRGLAILESVQFKVYLPKGVQAAVADPGLKDKQVDSTPSGTISK